MTIEKQKLPHESSRIFLTDGGLETDMIFNREQTLPEFASHTLFNTAVGCRELESYFRDYLDLARLCKTGFILDTATWRAQPGFADALGASVEDLKQVNHLAVNFARRLQSLYSTQESPVLVNGVVGPWGDGYEASGDMTWQQAEAYHAQQIGWLAEAGVDIISAITFTNAPEAIGFVKAAQRTEAGIVVSFTVETDGRLPTGQKLEAAIDLVDAETGAAPAYFMVNCAHPSHFVDALTDGDWLQRLRGFRCNASRKSHAELDACEVLDCGNPVELSQDYINLLERVPHANVFGGCCGSDIRHLDAIARRLTAETAAAHAG
ncbi:homocysteine S-methyltransferase family protein [Henriciella sp. AS95]|uniref:homocysteine S-methyltransferase family protein n=1 Tax=Henriciella sp. AS95 TaxID=3135782 RepID=UPI00317E0038